MAGALADGTTIVLIEDETAIRRFLRATLQAEGHRVFEAATASAPPSITARAISTTSVTCGVIFMTTGIFLPLFTAASLIHDATVLESPAS